MMGICGWIDEVKEAYEVVISARRLNIEFRFLLSAVLLGKNKKFHILNVIETPDGNQRVFNDTLFLK